MAFFGFFFRISRSERSGRYGTDGRREEPEWYGKRSRDVERDYDRRWVDDRHREHCDERRDRDSPEVRECEYLSKIHLILVLNVGVTSLFL